MNKPDNAMYTYYCDTCKTTSIVSNEWTSCGFCGGTVEDIGWVEQYNG